MSAAIVITKSDEYLIILPSGEHHKVWGTFMETRRVVGIEGNNSCLFQRKAAESTVAQFSMKFVPNEKGQIDLLGYLTTNTGGLTYHHPSLFRWAKKEFLNMPVVEVETLYNLVIRTRMFGNSVT
jgi:hypothetical protein